MNKLTKGLYHKFVVRRTDCRDLPGGKHDGCEYFVLDLTHDKHAYPALRAYAASCMREFPLLSADLFAKARAMRSAGLRPELPEDVKAVIDDAISRHKEVALTPSGSPIFINYGDSESRFIAHQESSCPACGGSGHIDDATVNPTFFDLVAHLHRQRKYSESTFGPGARTAGVLDHIRKELNEIEADPADVSEWIDVVLLALDGAWRAGFSPEQIAQAIAAKQAKNEARTWPDWRTADPGKAIEHVRGASE